MLKLFAALLIMLKFPTLEKNLVTYWSLIENFSPKWTNYNFLVESIIILVNIIRLLI